MDQAKRNGFIDRVVAAGRAAGVAVRPHPMGESTATAEQAASALGVQVGQIVKSLVFAVERSAGLGGVLCLVSGADRVDPAALSAVLQLADGERVRRATADEARAFTGFVIGGIPPFGHAPTEANTPVTVLADSGLATWGELWAACGTHLDVFPVSYEDLLRAAGARAVSIRETRA